MGQIIFANVIVILMEEQYYCVWVDAKETNYVTKYVSFGGVGGLYRNKKKTKQAYILLLSKNKNKK